MAATLNEKPGDAAQREITSALASLASRPAAAQSGKRQLKGPERAAVLMLALGEQHGAKIWGMLDDDELRQISVVMSTIGTI
jgi:flagellar motor switch protein FliG